MLASMVAAVLNAVPGIQIDEPNVDFKVWKTLASEPMVAHVLPCFQDVCLLSPGMFAE